MLSGNNADTFTFRNEPETVPHCNDVTSSSDDGSSDSDDASAKRDASSPHGLSLLTSKTRKLSFVPPPEEDTEVEMKAEIERSRTSHDCNLAALSLTKVPHTLPLTTLTKLSLSENKLRSLPEQTFSGANGQNLVEFDANSNELETLPASLFFLPRLEVLMLNHNRLTHLPAVVMEEKLPKGRVFLPSLERVGFEFNSLVDFPLCFFKYCPKLREFLLGQNEHVLAHEIPLAVLLQSPVNKAWGDGTRKEKVVVRLDNRPRLMRQIQNEDWAGTVPWINLTLHKIYPDKVLDYLYLGSMRTAQTISVYHDFDIGYVLTVGRDLDVLIEPGMKHKVLLVDDYPGADITAVFPEAFAFIDEARAAKKGILIHCFAGLSRSVTVAAAYIMRVAHVNCDTAMALIKEARPAAHPNEGFLKALKVNEAKLMSGAL